MIYDIYKGKEIFNQEIITEQLVYGKTVKKSRSYCIFSDPQIGRNFEYDPYIKVYNTLNQNSATELVRVSIRTGAPLPQEHTNKDKNAGKKRLKFTKEVAEFLDKAMDEFPNCYIYPSKIKTVYDAIYYDIQRTGISCIKYPKPNFMENIEK